MSELLLLEHTITQKYNDKKLKNVKSKVLFFYALKTLT